VESAKPGTQIVARFTDPKAKLRDGTQQPYLVMSDPAGGRRVVWIGSGETWRLRQYRESYHERFWTKLIRYAASGSQGRANKRIRLEMGNVFTANKFVEVETKVEAPGGEPLPRDAKPPRIKLTLPKGVPEKEIPTEFAMKSKPGSDGWYTSRFQVRSPGDYKIDVEVPDTKDKQSRSFSVKEANPELDNTRPDFDQMYRLASEADEVLARMSDAERQELKRRLQRPKLDPSTDKSDLKEDKLRLFFDLKNAHLIPTCMVTELKTQRTRLPYKDKWDEGWTIWPAEPPDQPIKFSYVLAAVVGLLSLEWLTRKLLRLA
jgi:hypothetical protein